MEKGQTCLSYLANRQTNRPILPLLIRGATSVTTKPQLSALLYFRSEKWKTKVKSKKGSTVWAVKTLQFLQHSHFSSTVMDTFLSCFCRNLNSPYFYVLPTALFVLVKGTRPTSNRTKRCFLDVLHLHSWQTSSDMLSISARRLSLPALVIVMWALDGFC